MPRRDIALAVLVAAIWGVNFTVIRVGLDGVPPLLLSALRYALAAFPLVLFLGRPRVPWRGIVAVGVVLGVVKFSLLFLGIDAGFPAGLASLVLQAQAGFTLALAAVALGVRPTRRQLTGLLVAASGLALIAVARVGAGGASPEGFALVIGAAAAWGVANLVIARVSGDDALRFMLWVSVVPPLPLLVLSLLFEGPRRDWEAISSLSWGSVGAIAYLAWGATVIGWGLWGLLLRRHPAGVVAPFSLLVPPFGLASAAVLLGEPLGVAELAATALVLGGVGLGAWRRAPAAPAVAGPPTAPAVPLPVTRARA